MRSTGLLALAGALALALSPTSALAQADGVRVERIDHSEYPTVEITVTAPPSLQGRSLPADAFTVYEDDEQRRVSIVDSPAITAPGVVIAIDRSGSMSGEPIARAREAAAEFVDQLPPQTEIAIVTFGNDSQVVLPFTTDADAALSALAKVDAASDETALYDGVIEAAELSATSSAERRSIVLLSDGAKTVGEASLDAAAEQVTVADTALYVVELQGSESDPQALRDLVTGSPSGAVVQASDAAALSDIYSELAGDLGNQYVLQYESASGGRTQLRLEVAFGGVVDAAGEPVDLPQQEAAPRVAEPEAPAPEPAPVFVIVPPLLAQRWAYLSGLGALALASLLVWLAILVPRRNRARSLLVERHAVSGPLLSNLAAWTTELAERGLRKRGLGQRLDLKLERAGLDVRPAEFVGIMVCASIVAFALGFLLAGVLLGLLLAALLPLATPAILGVLRDRRQAAFTEQLTDILQLISGSLRAGYGLLQGVDAVARDAAEPACSEFRRIVLEHRLGRDLGQALENCAERMEDTDFRWVVQAIEIHREVGGDLARVLDNVTRTIRDRAEVRRQVRTLSAEGRLSAIVLTILPFVVLAALQILSPNYLGELLQLQVGWFLLAAAVVLLLLGIIWVRRLTRISY